MSFDTTPYQKPGAAPQPIAPAPKRRINGWGWLAIIGIPAALFIGIYNANTSSADRNNTESYAIVHCQNAVKEKLKSPSTAEFVGTSATGYGTWTVTGSVNSQNGFGATVLSSFQCSVIVDDDGGRVRVDSLTTP